MELCDQSIDHLVNRSHNFQSYFASHKAMLKPMIPSPHAATNKGLVA